MRCYEAGLTTPIRTRQKWGDGAGGVHKIFPSFECAFSGGGRDGGDGGGGGGDGGDSSNHQNHYQHVYPGGSSVHFLYTRCLQFGGDDTGGYLVVNWLCC